VIGLSVAAPIAAVGGTSGSAALFGRGAATGYAGATVLEITKRNAIPMLLGAVVVVVIPVFLK